MQGQARAPGGPRLVHEFTPPLREARELGLLEDEPAPRVAVLLEAEVVGEVLADVGVVHVVPSRGRKFGAGAGIGLASVGDAQRPVKIPGPCVACCSMGPAGGSHVLGWPSRPFGAGPRGFGFGSGSFAYAASAAFWRFCASIMVEKAPARSGGAGATAGGASGPGAALSSAASMPGFQYHPPRNPN